MNNRLDLDVQDLPMDVFDLGSTGLELETLTTGHGMQEHAASTGSMPCSFNTVCCCACCSQTCSTPAPYAFENGSDELE
ncbi:thiomuracin/GE37468 family thiazolyl RiPP peptide [Nocardiopsis chromatogenes]|uniref:thiomuracin/GE37468 family thiazolyl RiPP peptide n=1 Tax=Nocardiopsis chromatogenes TaxID=280239 RepID=UPI00034BD41F|nr:thiomuracin/GE37468 family thiazolyl RiPP peptide [Nocardiopsis chromatogenes]